MHSEMYRRMAYAMSLATDTPTELIHSKSRLRSLVLCRAIMWHYLRHTYKLHLRTIAELSGKHHTTVLNAVRNVSHEIRQDREDTILTYAKFVRTFGDLYK